MPLPLIAVAYLVGTTAGLAATKATTSIRRWRNDGETIEVSCPRCQDSGPHEFSFINRSLTAGILTGAATGAVGGVISGAIAKRVFACKSCGAAMYENGKPPDRNIDKARIKSRELDANSWPDNPSCRKIVLVLDQDDINDLDERAEILTNEEIHILSSRPAQPNPAVQILIDQGLVTSGSVLVQNPFDKNLYYRKSEASEKIAVAKFLHFTTLCSHLGAREVKVEKIELNKEDRVKNDSVKSSAPALSSALGRKKEISSSLADRLLVTQEFDGGEPNIQAATELLQRTGLSNEPVFEDMLNKALINNKSKSSRIKLTLTTEGHQNSNILTKLKLTKPPIGLEANLDRKKHEVEEYTLDIAVKF